MENVLNGFLTNIQIVLLFHKIFSTESAKKVSKQLSGSTGLLFSFISVRII